MARSRPLAFLILCALFLAGCGGGGSSAARGGDVAPTAGDGLATVVVRTPLLPREDASLQGVSPDIDQVRFGGFNSHGHLTYGPVLRPVAEEHVLDGVPLDTSVIQVEHLDDGQVKGMGHHDVELLDETPHVIAQAENSPPSSALQRLEVSPAPVTAATGTALPFTCIGVLDDHRALDLTRFVFWSSSMTGFATMSNALGSQGVATAVAAGDTVISARQGGFDASVTLTVSGAALSALQVFPATSTIGVGLPLPLEARGLYADGHVQDLTAQVTWASDNETAVQVTAAGVATGLEAGSAEVSATFGSVSAVTTLNVDDSPLDSIEVTPDGTTLAENTARQYQAVAVLQNGTRQDVTPVATWTALTPALLTVSNNAPSKGLVRGIAPGGGQVQASILSVDGVADVEVTNATLSAFTLEFDQALSAPDTVRRYRAMGTFSDASEQDLTLMTTFSSSDDSVAVLNNSPTRRGQASVVGAVDDSATVTANFPTTAFQADGTLFVGLFAYVLSDLDSLVQPLIVDPDTGALTDTDGSAQGDDSPGEFVIHPNGLFLYVVNLFTEMVTVYEIDPDTGALNHVQDFPVDDCGCGTVLVVEPTGHRLYLVDSNIGQVKVLDIDLADGSLTDSGISEITGSFVEDAEMTPDGRFLQVLDLSDNVIYTYEIDPATGAPMPPTTTPTGGETPFDLAIDPLGRFLFVISDAGSTLESSLLDPFTGLPAAPFQFSISDQLMGMAVDPQGQTLVAGATALGGRARAKRGCAASREMVVEGCGCPDDLVYTFTIDPCDGFLDQTGTTATSPAPAGLAVDPRGRFAWTSSDFGEVVSGFALNREDFTAAPLDPRDLMLPELFFLLQMETTP